MPSDASAVAAAVADAAAAVVVVVLVVVTLVVIMAVVTMPLFLVFVELIIFASKHCYCAFRPAHSQLTLVEPANEVEQQGINN